MTSVSDAASSAGIESQPEPFDRYMRMVSAADEDNCYRSDERDVLILALVDFYRYRSPMTGAALLREILRRCAIEGVKATSRVPTGNYDLLDYVLLELADMSKMGLVSAPMPNWPGMIDKTLGDPGFSARRVTQWLAIMDGSVLAQVLPVEIANEVRISGLTFKATRGFRGRSVAIFMESGHYYFFAPAHLFSASSMPTLLTVNECLYSAIDPEVSMHTTSLAIIDRDGQIINYRKVSQ